MLVKYRKDEQYKNIKRKKKSDFSTTVKGVTRAFSLPERSPAAAETTEGGSASTRAGRDYV